MKVGGAAFASSTQYESTGEFEPRGTRWLTEPGMSLRDYFAAAAVPAAIYALLEVANPTGATARVARIAYEVADAMLTEREKSVPVEPQGETK